jgi:hypothetical protein
MKIKEIVVALNKKGRVPVQANPPDSRWSEEDFIKTPHISDAQEILLCCTPRFIELNWTTFFVPVARFD